MRTDSLKIKNFKKITSLLIMLFSFTYGYTQCGCSVANTITQNTSTGTFDIGTHTLGTHTSGAPGRRAKTSDELCIVVEGTGTLIITGTIYMNSGDLYLCSTDGGQIDFRPTLSADYSTHDGNVYTYADVISNSARTISGITWHNYGNYTGTSIKLIQDANAGEIGDVDQSKGEYINYSGATVTLTSFFKNEQNTNLINYGTIDAASANSSGGLTAVLQNYGEFSVTGDMSRQEGETYNSGEINVGGTLTLGGSTTLNLYMTDGIFRTSTLDINSGIYNVDPGSCAVFYVDNVVGVTCDNTYNGEISIIDVSYGPDAGACPSQANDAGSFKYSDFDNASACAQTLPVQFVDVYVVNNVLYWTTVEEKDNEKFIIERSLDGQNFEAIGEVKGAGDSNYDIQYLFEDENPILQTVYYRIKQVDIDGKYSYSKVVTQKGKEVEIVLYPNPVYDNKVNISINNIESKAFNYQIISSIGQIILQENVLVEENIFEKQINTENLLKGIYLVKVKTQEDVIIQKMIIE